MGTSETGLPYRMVVVLEQKKCNVLNTEILINTIIRTILTILELYIHLPTAIVIPTRSPELFSAAKLSWERKDT